MEHSFLGSLCARSDKHSLLVHVDGRTVSTFLEKEKGICLSRPAAQFAALGAAPAKTKTPGTVNARTSILLCTVLENVPRTTVGSRSHCAVAQTWSK